MSAGLNILSFNWHEPYLLLLAKTGRRFDVAEPDMGRSGVRRWDERARPVPDNIRVISQAAALRNLNEKRYDLALCHNFADLALVAQAAVPKILLFHNKLTTELALGGGTVGRDEYLAAIDSLAAAADVMVFVSASKREDWGFGRGMVIPPGVDAGDFPEYAGDTPKALRVGNRMKERDVMTGYSVQERIVAGIDNVLLGHNPGVEGARPAKSFDDLLWHYAHLRLYLNTTRHPYEDGYNLAMLEAMAAGMPVVSLAHPASPIENGVDGCLSPDVDELRSRIGELLHDREAARRMGARARENVLQAFGMRAFLGAWNDAFDTAASGRGTGQQAFAADNPKTLREGGG